MIPKTMVIASKVDKSVEPIVDNKVGPTPTSKMTPNKKTITRINGSQARRSEAEGSMVLLMAKTR